MDKAVFSDRILKFVQENPGQHCICNVCWGISIFEGLEERGCRFFFYFYAPVLTKKTRLVMYPLGQRGMTNMEIYGEYFFFENLMANLFILLLTARIWSLKPGKDRLFMGAVCASIYAFGIFTPAISILYHPISKVLFSCIIIKIVFREMRGASFGKLVATFFCAGFFLGGAVTALLYFTGMGGTVSSGGFYLENNSYLTILCCLGAGYCFLRFFLNIFKEKRSKAQILVDVTVKVGKKEKSLRGIVDTGNFLVEPITGAPVMIGEAEAVRELLPDDYEECKIRIIPYSSIGKEQGALLGVEADEIKIAAEGKVLENVEGVLAIYQGKLSEDGAYQVILHPEMIRPANELGA